MNIKSNNERNNMADEYKLTKEDILTLKICEYMLSVGSLLSSIRNLTSSGRKVGKFQVAVLRTTFDELTDRVKHFTDIKPVDLSKAVVEPNFSEQQVRWAANEVKRQLQLEGCSLQVDGNKLVDMTIEKLKKQYEDRNDKAKGSQDSQTQEAVGA